MPRRGHECRCCECDRCDNRPKRLVVDVDYPSGGGEMVPAAESQPSNWQDIQAAISTTCVVPSPQLSIARVRVVTQGQGYTSAPVVSITGGGGGPVVFGTVVVSSGISEVVVTEGGSGYSTPPAVVFPASNFPARGIAVVEGTIVSLNLVSGGAGYTEPPKVLFSGGTGARATAVVNQAGVVIGLQLNEGGNDYPSTVEVTIPGGSVEAVATATISGSVVRIDVEDPGVFAATRDIPTGVATNFNSVVQIAGPATAEARFSGKLTSITAGTVGGGFTSVPTVSISGGGGQGATAEVELRWQASHTRSSELSNCIAGLEELHSFDATSAQPPPNRLHLRESVLWRVQAATDTKRRTSSANSSQQVGPLLLSPWFFEGESIWVTVLRTWILINTGPEVRLDTFTRRLFSRIAPNTIYSIAHPPQPNSANNAQIEFEWRQYVDQKNDSFWYLETIAQQSGGSNLFIPFGTETVTLGTSNTRHQLINRSATFTYSSPAAQPVSFRGFSAQPSVQITFAQDAFNFFYVDDASIESGGQTNLPNGTTVTCKVALLLGHYFAGSAKLTGTVSNGILAQVSVLAGGLIQPPAALSLLNTNLGQDINFADMSRVATGESVFVTSRTHEQPVVQAECQPFVLAGEEAALVVDLTEQTDANGETYWTVSGVVVDEPGDGYVQADVVVFESDAPGIVAIAPVTNIILTRVAADINDLFPLGTSASFSFAIEQDQTEDGDPYWKLVNVQLEAAGAQNTVGQTVTVIADAPTLAQRQAVIRVDTITGTGGVATFSVVEAGRYFKETTGIGRVNIQEGGKFFIRQTQETAQRLPEISCIGPVSVETGWQRNQSDYAYNADDVGAVGEELVTNDFLVRTRRCPLPLVAVRFE